MKYKEYPGRTLAQIKQLLIDKFNESPKKWLEITTLAVSAVALIVAVIALITGANSDNQQTQIDQLVKIVNFNNSQISELVKLNKQNAVETSYMASVSKLAEKKHEEDSGALETLTFRDRLRVTENFLPKFKRLYTKYLDNFVGRFDEAKAADFYTFKKALKDTINGTLDLIRDVDPYLNRYLLTKPYLKQAIIILGTGVESMLNNYEIYSNEKQLARDLDNEFRAWDRYQPDFTRQTLEAFKKDLILSH